MQLFNNKDNKLTPIEKVSFKLEKNIQDLVAENAELIAFDLKRVDSLTKEQKAELLKIDESQRNLEARFAEIAGN